MAFLDIKRCLINKKIKNTVSRPQAASSNRQNHNIPSKMAVGKVIKKSRLENDRCPQVNPAALGLSNLVFSIINTGLTKQKSLCAVTKKDVP